MTLKELIGVCRVYTDLGWAVREQLHDLVDDPTVDTLEEQNGNAVRIIRIDFLIPVLNLSTMDEELEETTRELLDMIQKALSEREAAAAQADEKEDR